MKIISLTIVLFFLASMCFAGVPTFEQFSTHTKDQQEEMIRNASPDEKEQLVRYKWRLQIGENSWQRRLKERLVLDTKGFSGLYNLFILRHNLWSYYYNDAVDANKKSRMTPQAQEFAYNKITEQFSKSSMLNQGDFELLVKIAPTPEALKIDQEAGRLSANLHAQFLDPGQQIIITEDDVKKIDAEVEKIRDQIKKLPQWTPEQIKAAIDALPPEDPHR